MAVAAPQCRRVPGGRAIELGRGRPAAPAVLVEPTAEHPGRRRQRARVCRDSLERRLDRRFVAQVELVHLDRPPGEVDVRVVPAGGHEPAAQVDPVRAGVGLPEICGPPDGPDHAVDGDERFRAGAVADMDPAAVEELRAHARRMLATALDRCADEAAVFGPASVVVTDLLVTEEVRQHEPGVGAPLADAAIRDGLGRAIEALLAVDALELIDRLEAAILAHRARPRDIDGALDVTAALRPFLWEVLRREELARELLRRPHVDELLAVLLDGLEHVLTERPERGVGAARGV